MKKTSFYGAMALSLLFTACSDDNLNEPVNNGPLEADQTFYVNMSISGDIPEGTRASGANGTPEDGTADFASGTENFVNNAYFVFYDADGNVIGDIVPIDLNDPAQVDQDTRPVGATVEKSYRSIVPVVVRKGENKPTQVICYINPISPSSLQNPLNVIQTRARDIVYTEGSGGKKYFAMSNSVYYPNSNMGTLPQIAAPILDTQLFETEEEAQNALDLAAGLVKNPDYTEGGEEPEYLPASEALLVQIYVERYASKLSFSYKGIEPYKTATRVYEEGSATDFNTPQIELTFEPEYWAVNGESKTTYVIKSFRRESDLGQIMADNYPYSILNYRINPLDPKNINYLATKEYAVENTLNTNNGWEWNNQSYHRSYWSISPAYFTDNYPEVASDVNDNLNQTYLTYNDLVNGKGFEADNTDAQYFKETTVGTKALASDNPAAAVASVILVGKYTIKIDDTPVTLPNKKDGTATGFYTYLSGPVEGITEDHPYIYFDNEDGGVNSIVPGGGSMLKRFLAQTTILFKLNANGSYSRYSIDNQADLEKLGSALEVAKIDGSVLEQVGSADTDPLKLQGNARSLQFKNVTFASGIYIASGNGYKEIVADNVSPTNTQIRISEANAILMQQVGYAYYYYLGEGYFNIPVKHLGWYRKGNANRYNQATGEVEESSKIDWSIVRVGDFGMVRNHAYTVNVNKITGLASGIGGEDVPIVPPANTNDYYIAYKVNILKWAVVPDQGVDL